MEQINWIANKTRFDIVVDIYEISMASTNTTIGDFTQNYWLGDIFHDFLLEQRKD